MGVGTKEFIFLHPTAFLIDNCKYPSDAAPTCYATIVFEELMLCARDVKMYCSFCPDLSLVVN